MTRIQYPPRRFGRWTIVLGTAVAGLACQPARVTQGGPPSGTDGGGVVDSPPAPASTDAAADVSRPATPPSDAPVGTACVGLCQRQMTCAGGGTTTVSGTVHAPTPARFGAADPLYNALVYVPNAPVAAFTAGVSCQRCERASGSPLVSVLTGPDGRFRLTNVPTGASIPLVIQIGRWRRQVTIPNVAACTDTALPDELTRMPRTRMEGDIPAIALAAGTFDPFDCTLRKIGIDESEFTLPSGPGRVAMWPYGGHQLATMGPDGDALMGSIDSLSKYDLLILPCDDPSDRPPAQLDNLRAYADKGGRVFLTDLEDTWLRGVDAWKNVVQWDDTLDALGLNFTCSVDTTFPKGMAFSSWLSVVGAARPAAGQLPVHDPFFGGSRVADVVAPTQRWIFTATPEKTIQQFTFNTPVGSADDQQCGRVVYSQFHVAEDSGPPPSFGQGADKFPAACSNDPMTPQEKALEFMLFDLSSCVQSDQMNPVVIP